MLISFAECYRRHRLTFLAATIAGLAVLLLGLGLWGFLATLPPPPAERHAFAPDKAPHKAIVLTGSHDRVQAAMKLLRDGAIDELFISGVYQKLKLAELLEAMQETPACAADNCIELGHRATNTRQNACESLEWLEKNNIRRFYLITSDYHWPRSFTEFQAVLRRKNYEAKILPYIVRSPAYDSLTRGKAWSGEYIKWLVANGRIFLENFLPKNTIMDCFLEER